MREWLLYNRIEETVLKDRKCSLSYIQRRFHLSYYDAKEYIKILIHKGIVDNQMKVIGNIHEVKE